MSDQWVTSGLLRSGQGVEAGDIEKSGEGRDIFTDKISRSYLDARHSKASKTFVSFGGSIPLKSNAWGRLWHARAGGRSFPRHEVIARCKPCDYLFGHEIT